uniref:Sec39 domain-containing protein n=1 Tax=Mesocestoides corti TaxID=53468 RepID=A0A5K3EWL7_MESCO
MPPSQQKPVSRVAKTLASTEFIAKLSSPWVCELRQDSMKAFCHLANRLIRQLDVDIAIYSFLPESQFTDAFVDSRRQQDTTEPPKRITDSATVICIDNLWQWDPVSAVAPYLRSASIMDQILTRLPCSEQGHTLVDWCKLSGRKNFPSLKTNLAMCTSDAGRQLLEDLFLCQKQVEEVKLIQMALLDVAFTLNAPNADKLVKSAEPLQAIPAAVFSTLCETKQYDYLPVVELGLAAAEAADISKAEDALIESRQPLSSTGNRTNIDHLLRKYENAIMLAHSEDASVASLTDDDALQNCRPILLNAIKDAYQLTNPDEVLLLLIRLVGLLPSRGCNPSVKPNAQLIEAIDGIFEAGLSSPASKGTSTERFFNNFSPESIGRSTLAAAYRRHLLPSYRESVRNVGFPQLVSPVVQMFRDLAAAHQDPASASPALQSLKHWPTTHSDPTILSSVGKLIAMSGVVGRRSPQPYTPSLVILVVHGTITWTLARNIISAVTRNTKEPLEVFIICNSLLRGRDVFHQCLS